MVSPVKTEAIIFDLDGTLLNTINDIAAAMNAVLRRHDYPTHEPESYKRMVGWGLRELVERAVTNVDVPDTQKELLTRQLRDQYHANPHDATEPYAGIVDLLERLRSLGYPLGVLSNKAESLCHVIVAATIGTSWFEAVQGQRDSRPAKPDPTGALEVARLLGAPPESTIFVGDSAVDVETALNAGMTPVGVTWGFREPSELRAAGARTIIEEPLQLIPLLERGARRA
jgi:phosphoglycolate phosphatase